MYRSWAQLITVTSTLIFPDITITSSNNCLLYSFPNVFTEYVCENHVANIRCDADNSVVHIINVKVGQLANFDCGNGNGSLLNRNDQCQATREEKDCLACAFMKSCDGKADCSIHVAHDTYLGFYLPCRNLRINIPFVVLYDCIEGTLTLACYIIHVIDLTHSNFCLE